MSERCTKIVVEVTWPERGLTEAQTEALTQVIVGAVDAMNGPLVRVTFTPWQGSV